MNYAFGSYEAPFAAWRQEGFPGAPEKGQEFLRNLESPNFPQKLWRHQLEAIQRTIYAFEVLKKPDLLLKVVTGGGKTVIIGGLIAYLRSVHEVRQHLVLVPNTVVRARLARDLDPKSKGYVFRQFPFFCGLASGEGERLSFHEMKGGMSPEGIRSADLIVGNVHQIYEARDNWKVLYANCDRIGIYNDEAHNMKAEQYNDLIDKLKPKRVLRLDTTATPDRLDGLHPDSELIYAYDIREAMRDKVVKRVVVFNPEIEKVKFTYYDRETKKEITAEEIPWEEIEKNRIPAVRYVMNSKPMEQQLEIALECLRHQRKAVPRGKDGKPVYKPLLFVVALSVENAGKIQAALEAKRIDGEPLKVLCIHNESDEERREDAMAMHEDVRNCKYDAIVSVMMLREGWDVKNISVILLFRKFCFKTIGGQTYSVYGPQVIGRGLRRVDPRSADWEQCHVVDHPVLKHDWLWDMLSAERYPVPLNPGAKIDPAKIPEPPPTPSDPAVGPDAPVPPIDLSALPPIPEPGEGFEPILEWERYLDAYEYDRRDLDIEQKIRQIHAKNLDSGLNTLETKDLPEISQERVEQAAKIDPLQLRDRLAKQVRRLAYDALMEYDRNPDGRQEILLKVIHGHLRKRFLDGHDLHACEDRMLIEGLRAVMEQVREVFLNPALVAGILGRPIEIETHAKPAGKAL